MKKYALETLLAFVFLACGIVLKDPAYFIASGLFAIATQIGLFRSETQ